MRCSSRSEPPIRTAATEAVLNMGCSIWPMQLSGRPASRIVAHIGAGAGPQDEAPDFGLAVARRRGARNSTAVRGWRFFGWRIASLVAYRVSPLPAPSRTWRLISSWPITAAGPTKPNRVAAVNRTQPGAAIWDSAPKRRRAWPPQSWDREDGRLGAAHLSARGCAGAALARNGRSGNPCKNPARPHHVTIVGSDSLSIAKSRPWAHETLLGLERQTPKIVGKRLATPVLGDRAP